MNRHSGACQRHPRQSTRPAGQAGWSDPVHAHRSHTRSGSSLAASHGYDEAGHLLGEYDAAGNALKEYVWLADTPVLVLGKAADERVIDNTDTASVTVAGTWTAATSPGGFVGANLQQHAAGAGSDSFTWKLSPATTQSYRLYVRHPASAAASSTATYTVSHAGGASTVVLNQQSGGNQWRLLGSYSFNAGGAGSLKLAAQTNGIVIADAVKIVPTNQQASVFFIHADQIDTPRMVQDAQYNNRWAWDPDGSGSCRRTRIRRGWATSPSTSGCRGSTSMRSRGSSTTTSGIMIRGRGGMSRVIRLGWRGGSTLTATSGEIRFSEWIRRAVYGAWLLSRQ